MAQSLANSNPEASSALTKPHPQWESPRLAVLSSSDAIGVEGRSSVTVPFSGYYAVSFGYANPIRCALVPGKKRKRSQSSNHVTCAEDSLASANSVIPVSAHLQIQSDTITTQHYSLPWRESQESLGVPQVLDPPSLYLGKMLWIEQDSRLTVKLVDLPLSRTDSNGPEPPTFASPSDSKQVVDIVEAPHFGVRLQHVPLQRPPVQAPKKIWACTVCRKTFPSIHRLSQHQEVTHRDIIFVKTAGVAAASSSSSLSSRFSSSLWTTPLQVVYNDPFLAVVIKPQGMAVMGDVNGQTLQRSSLLLALLPPEHLQNGKNRKIAWTVNPLVAGKREEDDEQQVIMDSYLGKPRPVHRLDSATGGLLVVAKTNRSDSALRNAFANRACHKTYRALVFGNVLPDQGECTQDLSGKASLTRFRVLYRSRSVTSRDGWLSIMELHPHTGRQHQLRRHMQMMGHPIWGDRRYGGWQPSTNSCLSQEYDDKDNIWQSRLCLWAVAIRFSHPVSQKEVSCRMDEPEWLQRVVDHEETMWKQANT